MVDPGKGGVKLWGRKGGGERDMFDRVADVGVKCLGENFSKTLM